MGARTFRAFPRGRLRYAYDAVGNRLTKAETVTASTGSSTQRTSYTLDVNDRLTQETTQESINGGAFSPKSSTSYQFDANGNLIRADKTEAGASSATATTLYTWSPQHWLTSVTTNAGTLQGKTVQYALSTEGLRLSARTAPEAVANKIVLQGENPLTQAEREQMEVEHYA